MLLATSAGATDTSWRLTPTAIEMPPAGSEFVSAPRYDLPAEPAADSRYESPINDAASGTSSPGAASSVRQPARPAHRLRQRIANRLRTARRPEPVASAAEPAPAESNPFTAADATAHLPGEFEPCAALLLSCDELAAQFPEVFAEIVAAAQKRRVPVVCLVSSRETGEYAEKVLAKHHLPAGSVRYLRIPHDSMWVRDYGPLCLVRAGGRQAIVDPEYGAGLQRVNDEQVPGVLAQLLGEKAIAAPITLDGGNLLSNGQGLCLTTTSLLDANMERQLDEAALGELLHRFVGAEEVMVLEPLSGEPTGHVDMFATFLAPDVIAVGSYDPSRDPVNADILDRNAARLADIRTPRGPLRVVRIPMPSNDDGVWRSYTNVIMANGVLMVPVYPELDAGIQQEALNVYRRLLPNWQVVTIDSSGLIACGGALHCISNRLVSMAGWREARERSVAQPAEPNSPPPRRLVRRSS